MGDQPRRHVPITGSKWIAWRIVAPLIDNNYRAPSVARDAVSEAADCSLQGNRGVRSAREVMDERNDRLSNGRCRVDYKLSSDGLNRFHRRKS